jgi:CRISPR/Cas system-associated exonuclease Cas4 (RecB family)
VLSNLITESQTLEESFAAEARLSGAQLPIRIDENTVLSEIEALGETLTITYDVAIEISGFRPDFKTTLAQLQCAPEMFGANIARGGIVEMIYRGPNDRVIETFKITQKDCAL